MPPPTKSSRFSFELWEPWCKNGAPAFRRSAVTRQKTAASSFFFSCFMWASVVSGSPFTCTKKCNAFPFPAKSRVKAQRNNVVIEKKKKKKESTIKGFFFSIQTNSSTLIILWQNWSPFKSLSFGFSFYRPSLQVESLSIMSASQRPCG